MTQREKNIEELKKLSDRVIKDSDEITKAVDEAKILTPSKQVEKSLTSYITSRLENLKKNDELGDMIVEAIGDRLPEFTPSDLISLYRTHGSLTNEAHRDVMVPFTKENEGTLVDSLRKADQVSNAQAKQISEGITDKEQLQALQYLSQVMSVFKKTPQTIDPADFEEVES